MVYLLAIVVVVGVLYVIGKAEQAEFRRKFPPITDDEFMARCKPGTNREIALKVRRIVSTQLGVDYERIYPESSFVNDLGCD